MKIGLIVDQLNVAGWQADVLLPVAGEHEFLIYNCTSAQSAGWQLRHALYYLLNLVSMRSSMTRPTALPASLKIVAVRTFEAPVSGAWQELPPPRLGLDRIGQ